MLYNVEDFSLPKVGSSMKMLFPLGNSGMLITQNPMGLSDKTNKCIQERTVKTQDPPQYDDKKNPSCLFVNMLWCVTSSW